MAEVVQIMKRKRNPNWEDVEKDNQNEVSVGDIKNSIIEDYIVSQDMPLSESKKNRDAVIISFFKEEHDLKMKHMAKTNSWAQKEHEQKMKNLISKNILIEKKLCQFN
ncbi:unnamed protein product [Euphydryas editha]|uniref:Uncharacterized protein n=1 Tax=Euphydryas editha TaxID=104508 RepID=A0AAU9TSA4_EUPED|nr:unnamed protein product [Euphydryas editha]